MAQVWDTQARIPVNYLAISVQFDDFGFPEYLNAVEAGIVNSRDGRWLPYNSYVTKGRCNAVPTATGTAETATTAAETTTVDPTSFPYEVVALPGREILSGGTYLDPIPDDGTYPIDGRNPRHPDALTLREFMELPPGTPVCVREGGARSDDYNGTATRAWVSRSVANTGESLGYLGISVGDSTSEELPAVSAGVINGPDGTWAPTLSYVSKGRC
ncbi:MAG: hypothetical protein Q7V57_19705 [Actinomycetota bacterium]|nr:hypothetical protein [Actinomycetota bacterium]